MIRIPVPPFEFPLMRFDMEDYRRARDDWGMNCGPGALAGVLGLRPEEVLPLIPDFRRKHYTTEIMMREALSGSGTPYIEGRGAWPDYGLARVLWHGPWWDDDRPFAREYHSHWVGVRNGDGRETEIFDINAIRSGGWISLPEWRDHLVPWLLEGVEPLATGGYEIAESFTIVPGGTPLPVEEEPGHMFR